MKIVTIDETTFDEFAKNHKYRNYYQTSMYGNIMKSFNYEVKYIGIYNDTDKMIGASLLLIQNSVMKTKLAYAPRGILFDYTDSVQLEELVENMKNVLGKENIISLRMDPAIPLSIRDKNGNIININTEAKIAIENLTSAGFSYKGETLYFETEKPRWEALTILEKDIREIYKSFDKRTRNKINKAIKSGIEVYRDTEKNISYLYEFIKENNLPIEYYKEICNNFNDKADIFYAKLNTEKFVSASKKIYEEETENNETLSIQFQNLAQQNRDRRDIFNKKVNSDKLLSIYKNNLIFATNMLKEYPNGIIVAGALNVVYDNAAYLIVEGAHKKFKNLNANYLLKWQIINDYNNEKLKYYNLNAVTGNFESNNKYSEMNEIKTSYNGIITEYIGEFDIILNSFKYKIHKNFSKSD